MKRISGHQQNSTQAACDDTCSDIKAHVNGFIMTNWHVVPGIEYKVINECLWS